MTKKLESEIERLLEENREHLKDDQLFQLAITDYNPQVNKQLREHLEKCEICNSRWKQLIEVDLIEASTFDAVELNLAAGPIEKLVNFLTSDKKYSISIYPALSNTNKGLITLKVMDKELAGKLEGKIIIVKDAKNSTILEGEVFQGSVSREINDIHKIDLNSITIGPKYIK